MMSIGIWQIVLILVIVLIIFGAGKLPRVMGDVAKGIKNFKEGLSSDTDKDKDAKPAEGEPKTIDATVAAKSESDVNVKKN